jgi:hypothetical protein
MTQDQIEDHVTRGIRPGWIGEGGETVDIDAESGSFGIVTGNMVSIVIPHDELLVDEPRIRVAVTTDIGGAELLDVNGELPSDPMIYLDGLRTRGPLTADVIEAPDGFIIYGGPTTVPVGGVLDTAFCLFDLDGDPQIELDVASTLGNPPSSELASHGNGTTDETGCVSFPLPVLEPEGESLLSFFDGTDVHEVTTIIVVTPTYATPD